MKVKRELLDALRNLKKQVPTNRWGICRFLSLHCDQHVYQLFRNMCLQWPKYSGSVAYPVPSPMARVSAADAFWLYDRWSKRSAYGRLRYELIDWLIAELEKSLEVSTIL